MQKLFYSKTLTFLVMFIPIFSFANVEIKSRFGTKVIFSEKRTGVNYDPYAWGRLLFHSNGKNIDISIKDRYFTEDGTSQLSPSGQYLIINSISGGYVDTEDGKKKYTDRAYCSVIDMENGCYISDWDGEACGYEWKKDEDILASSDEPDADTFDFQSMRPSLKNAESIFSTLNEDEIKGYLRCDKPSKSNINSYQKLISKNKKYLPIIAPEIKIFLSKELATGVIKDKSFLFSEPKESFQLKSYLIPRDKVKIIDKSKDNQWVNIGYIQANGTPIIAWVKSNALN